MSSPLCFVLMPFGTKPDPTGRPAIDFDRIYETAIRPAVEDVGLVALRGDGERTGGIVHKPMYERLMLCEYAVADLTCSNANVFYELGIRHASRPRTTVAIFAAHQPIPFDVGFVRALPYDLGNENQFREAEGKALRDRLASRLRELRDSNSSDDTFDSPVFQLLEGWRPVPLAHEKTDTFRQKIEELGSHRARIARAPAKGTASLEELIAIEAELRPFDAQEVGILVDLFLAYRALEAWDRMISLHGRMPEALRRQILVREQLAFALNRRARSGRHPGDRAGALEILEVIESERGANPETCGLIGSIHKDRWKECRESDPVAAKGHLRAAIRAYTRGFEADWRDGYPGINAVTLLDVLGDAGALAARDRLLPVVRFSTERKIAGGRADYWDHATMLELAVLASEAEIGMHHLEEAAAVARVTWEPKTTAENLGFIRDARAARSADIEWIERLIEGLDVVAKSFARS